VGHRTRGEPAAASKTVLLLCHEERHQILSHSRDSLSSGAAENRPPPCRHTGTDGACTTERGRSPRRRFRPSRPSIGFQGKCFAAVAQPKWACLADSCTRHDITKSPKAHLNGPRKRPMHATPQQTRWGPRWIVRANALHRGSSTNHRDEMYFDRGAGGAFPAIGRSPPTEAFPSSRGVRHVIASGARIGSFRGGCEASRLLIDSLVHL
jgi:hypothetical protein